MTNAVQVQHPAVVLRSSYELMRALLLIATIAIIGLTIAVLALALNAGVTKTGSARAHAKPAMITDSPGHWQR